MTCLHAPCCRPVAEVLFFDGGPQDADKRILTVQVGRAAPRPVGPCLPAPQRCC